MTLPKYLRWPSGAIATHIHRHRADFSCSPPTSATHIHWHRTDCSLPSRPVHQAISALSMRYLRDRWPTQGCPRRPLSCPAGSLRVSPRQGHIAAAAHPTLARSCPGSRWPPAFPQGATRRRSSGPGARPAWPPSLRTWCRAARPTSRRRLCTPARGLAGTARRS